MASTLSNQSKKKLKAFKSSGSSNRRTGTDTITANMMRAGSGGASSSNFGQAPKVIQKKIKIGGSRKSQVSQESLHQTGLIAPAAKKTQKLNSSETLTVRGNSATLTTKIAPKVKMSQH